MNWEAALRSRLIDDSAVAALVADRVFLKFRPQSSLLPAVVVTMVSDPRPQLLGGAVPGRRQSRVQIDCWADGGSGTAPQTRAKVVALREAVIAALAAPGTFYGVLFGGAGFDPVRDLGEPTETGFLHRDSFDVQLMHN